MGQCRRFTRHLGCGLAAAVLVAAMAPGASAQQLGKGKEGRYLVGENLHLKDQGSFFIGGVNKQTQYATSSTASTTNQSIVIGQMYVQFQIPEDWNPEKARNEGKWPVIMVHGSTHSGACVESTPHGTEGWAPYYVQKGFPVFVVDQAGRGRSGYDESTIHEGKALLLAGQTAAGSALIPNIGRITSNGSWTAWFGHLVVPGTATTCTDILTCELQPHGWRADDPSPPTIHPDPAGYAPAYALDNNPDALDMGQVSLGGAKAANEPPGLNPVGLFSDPHFGPQPYGPAARYALKYYKQLLPNTESSLPSSTCNAFVSSDPSRSTPACVPATIAAANTWTPFDLALLVEKIGAVAGGAVVATHSQSGIMGHHMTRDLKQRGHLSYLKGLITIEGGCSFANSGLLPEDFDKVPYLALKGDYTAFSAQCQTSVDAINARRAAGQGSAAAEYVQLDAPQYNGAFNGVTHMMMDGTNNLQVADVMLAWGKANIRGDKK